MKYILVAFNHLTLCKSLKYIDDKFGKENSLLIYTDSVQRLPERIEKEYRITKVVERKSTYKGRLHNLFNEISNAKMVSRILNELIAKETDDIVLVVFKDVLLREATYIERAFKKFGKRMHLWIIEEGLALYATGTYNVSYKWAKKLIYKFFGVSTYPLEGKTQGMNKYIEKVIAEHPELLKEKYKDRNILIEQQIDIFDEDFSRYFVEAVVGKIEKSEKFDFIFLTMPMQEIVHGTKMSYEDFLTRLFSILSDKGKTLIKCHPRDKFDYSHYLSENVQMCDEKLNSLPFECLNTYFGKPRLLSLYSSASVNCSGNVPNLFLYKLIGIEKLSFDVSEDFLQRNNIIDCDSFDMLSDIL